MESYLIWTCCLLILAVGTPNGVCKGGTSCAASVVANTPSQDSSSIIVPDTVITAASHYSPGDSERASDDDAEVELLRVSLLQSRAPMMSRDRGLAPRAKAAGHVSLANGSLAMEQVAQLADATTSPANRTSNATASRATNASKSPEVAAQPLIELASAANVAPKPTTQAVEAKTTIAEQPETPRPTATADSNHRRGAFEPLLEALFKNRETLLSQLRHTRALLQEGLGQHRGNLTWRPWHESETRGYNDAGAVPLDHTYVLLVPVCLFCILAACCRA